MGVWTADRLLRPRLRGRHGIGRFNSRTSGAIGGPHRDHCGSRQPRVELGEMPAVKIPILQKPGEESHRRSHQGGGACQIPGGDAIQKWLVPQGRNGEVGEGPQALQHPPPFLAAHRAPSTLEAPYLQRGLRAHAGLRNGVRSPHTGGPSQAGVLPLKGTAEDAPHTSHVLHEGPGLLPANHFQPTITTTSLTATPHTLHPQGTAEVVWPYSKSTGKVFREGLLFH